jgi:beta-glucanase (GH16 family)
MKLIQIFNLVFPLLICYYIPCIGQTPANDLTWQIDTAKSDEFNSTSINTSKWHILDCPSGDCCNWGGGTAFEKGNATDSGGLLRLRVDGPGYAPIPCDREQYATGGLASDSAYYTYGYYEMYAEFPGFYSNGSPCGAKFQPSLWMAYVQADTTCVEIHNEIDPVIPGPLYTNASANNSGWSYQNGNCGAYTVGQAEFNSPVPLFAAFHKYGLEWNTNKIIFYFDDLPYAEFYNSPTMVMHPMYLYIEQGLGDASYPFCPDTPFPQYYSVDYFRDYTLKLDCGTSSLMLTNADLAAYVFSVKSDITFGNGRDTISLNSTDVKYFRAVNTITINGTFTAPLGSELGLIPTPCN